jgi:hypothetical protein
MVPPPAPTLLRTSTLQPAPLPPEYVPTRFPLATVPDYAQPVISPYEIFSKTKAVLHIEGDLMSMCEIWTEEEWKSKRRLVEFQRWHEGTKTSTSFKPVCLGTRTLSLPCISCIAWEEDGELDLYVTSVDIIQLLESLTGVRFTVEDKNRIRRNLEQFKPVKVDKQTNESFYNLISGFPIPRPRTMEKRIKVLKWSNLSTILTWNFREYVCQIFSSLIEVVG